MSCFCLPQISRFVAIGYNADANYFDLGRARVQGWAKLLVLASMCPCNTNVGVGRVGKTGRYMTDCLQGNENLSEEFTRNYESHI